MRNTLENLDTTSVKGYGITLLSGILSMANVEAWMKLLALAVTIVAGISTICYNYVKIKKSKSEP